MDKTELPTLNGKRVEDRKCRGDGDTDLNVFTGGDPTLIDRS